MNKNSFISALRQSLSGLPLEDIEKSIAYYIEIIDDRIEDGLSEEEAVEALGSVEECASEIIAEIPLSKLVKGSLKNKCSLKVWEIILLIIGAPLWIPLVLSAICIIFSVYISIWSVVVVFYAVSVSFAATGLCGILSFLIPNLSGNIAQILVFSGCGLILLGLSIFMFMLCNLGTKYLCKLIHKTVSGIKSALFGRVAVK